MANTTRRTFVKASAACLAGAALASNAAAAMADEPSAQPKLDVLVVGGGGSGLAAAVTVAELGKTVTVLEKQGIPGGTFAISHCESISLDDGTGEYMDAEQLFDYWMDETVQQCNEELMQKVTAQINDTLAWLEDYGVPFYVLQNHTRPDAPAPILFKSPSDTGAPQAAAGAIVTGALAAKVEELGGTILTDTVATKLILDGNGAVIGVEAQVKDADEPVQFYTEKVILTCGSFESGIGGDGNPVINEYLPKLLGKNMWHIGMGYAANTGDGIMMGRDAGAKLEFHIPYVRGRFWFASSNETVTGDSVLVNGDGARFADESGLYREVYEQAVENGGNERLFHISGPLTAVEGIGDLVDGEKVFAAETPESLAEAAGIDADTFCETVAHYNDAATNGEGDAFGKPAEHLVPIDEAPLYAESVSLMVGGCLGGLVVDGCARVLDENNEPIANLYSAGDTCNASFHGAFYLGSGSNTCFALNSGRIAAREAVAAL